MNIIKGCLFLILSLFLTFNASAFSKVKKLTGKEITAQFIGKNFIADGTRWDGTIRFHPDGTYSGKDTRSRKNFKGLWEIRGDTLCVLNNASFRVLCDSVKNIGSGAYKMKSTKYYRK